MKRKAPEADPVMSQLMADLERGPSAPPQVRSQRCRAASQSCAVAATDSILSCVGFRSSSTWICHNKQGCVPFQQQQFHMSVMLCYPCPLCAHLHFLCHSGAAKLPLLAHCATIHCNLTDCQSSTSCRPESPSLWVSPILLINLKAEPYHSMQAPQPSPGTHPAAKQQKLHDGSAAAGAAPGAPRGGISVTIKQEQPQQPQRQLTPPAAGNTPPPLQEHGQGPTPPAGPAAAAGAGHPAQAPAAHPFAGLPQQARAVKFEQQQMQQGQQGQQRQQRPQPTPPAGTTGGVAGAGQPAQATSRHPTPVPPPSRPLSGHSPSPQQPSHRPSPSPTSAAAPYTVPLPNTAAAVPAPAETTTAGALTAASSMPPPAVRNFEG